jgi:hypothetical protein
LLPSFALVSSILIAGRGIEPMTARGSSRPPPPPKGAPTGCVPQSGTYDACQSADGSLSFRRLVEDDAGVRAEVVRDTLARVEELQSSAKVIERQIDALVKASGTSLTDNRRRLSDHRSTDPRRGA